MPPSLRLTDSDVYKLVIAGSDYGKQELRKRIRWAAIRRMPSPHGTCPGGYRVTVDDKGAMASGYVMHIDRNSSVCQHDQGKINWDEKTPKAKALLKLIKEMR